jgi:hypothetical protein
MDLTVPMVDTILMDLTVPTVDIARLAQATTPVTVTMENKFIKRTKYPFG